MHNLNHHNTGGGKLNLNFLSACDPTNKSMSLSHPSLSQGAARPLRYLTATERSCSPLWTALTTAQVITIETECGEDIES